MPQMLLLLRFVVRDQLSTLFIILALLQDGILTQFLGEGSYSGLTILAAVGLTCAAMAPFPGLAVDVARRGGTEGAECLR